MGCTLRELFDRLDARELAEWRAFDQVHPLGSFRADLHAATIASTIARCHGSKSNIDDFLRIFGHPKPEAERQDPAEMLAILTRLADVQRARSPMTCP